MTNLKMNTVRATLIALMAAAPMAAFAGPQSGSPQQSIAEDPDEYAAPSTTLSSSNGTQTEPLYDSFDKADVVENVNGSIHSGDARRDD